MIKTIEICKSILYGIFGTILLLFSVYYTLFVFYPGIDYISIGSFVGGIVFIILGLDKYKKRNYDYITVKCGQCNEYLKVVATYGDNFVMYDNEYATCPYCGETFEGNKRHHLNTNVGGN